MKTDVIDNKILDISIFNTNNPYLDIWRVESSQDNLLKEYFLQTNAFLELKNTKKFVISWRKWTWKSALKSQFETINKDKKDINIMSLNFDEIFTSTFFDNLSYDNIKTYRDLIKFIMNIRLLMLIADEETVEQDIREWVIEFLTYNWFRLDSFSQLYGKLQDNDEILLDKVSVNLFWVFSWEKNFKNDKEDYNKINYAQLLPDLELFIFNTLKKTWKEYYILIDKLDEFWSSYWDMYDRMIVNFLTVIKDLNYKIRYFRLFWNSKIIVFIRSDMVDVIRWLDWNLNKILQDEMIKIDWQFDINSWFESSLCKMIEKRIEYWLKVKNKPYHYEKPFIKNSLINTLILKDDPYLWIKNKHDIELKKGLFNRTFLRPRDFVKFFHFLSTSMSWENFMKNYSEYLLSEIQDELTPILMKIWKVDIAIKALSKTVSNNRSTFRAEDYIKNYLDIYKLDNCNNETDQKIESYARQTLNKFYDYSVFWNKVKDKYWEWNDFYRFNYRESSIVSFDESQECILHSWLYKALWVI